MPFTVLPNFLTQNNLNNASGALSERLYNTGQTLYNLISSSSAGVSSLSISGSAAITGALTFSGIGGLNIYQSGNNIILFSGGGGGIGGDVTNNYFINSGSGSYVFRNYINNGIDKQFINFPVLFDTKPLVISNLNNDVYDTIIPYQISGSNTSGFWAVFGDTIPNTGYFLDVWVCSSTGTGLATTVIINNIIGGGGDTSQLSGLLYQTGSNLYNLITGCSGVFNNSGAQYQSQLNILTTNLTVTGATLDNKINTLSGYANNFLVHRIGDESISGFKEFNGGIYTPAIQAAGGGDSIIDIDGKYLYDSNISLSPALDWSNRILSGCWTAECLNIISGAGGIAGSSINNAITGSGTLNYIPRFTSISGIITGSIYDNGLGRIGLGTTSLSHTINLRGTTGSEGNLGINITNTDGANMFFGKQAGLNNRLLFQCSNQSINFESIGINALDVGSNGNTMRGGGSNPALSLYNRDLNANVLSITNTGVDIGSYTALMFAQQTDDFNYAQIRGYSEQGGHRGALEFLVSSGTKANWQTGIKISHNGNVGIGIGSLLPASKLDVSGSIIGRSIDATHSLKISGQNVLTGNYSDFTGLLRNAVYITGSQAISGEKRFYNSIGGVYIHSLDVTSDVLEDQYIDLNSSRLFDATPAPSLNWTTRELINSAGTTTIDWENKLLSGSWNTLGSLKISGHSVITGFDTNLLASAANLTTTGATLNNRIVSLSGQAIGSVILQRDNGTQTAFSPNADTDTARGIALEAAFAAHNTGDTLLVNAGTYTVTSALTLSSGASLIGLGMPILKDMVLTEPLLKIINDNLTIEGLKIVPSSCGVGVYNATPQNISNLILRDLVITPTGVDTNAVMFSEVYNGGNTEHILTSDFYNCVFEGGSSLGYGVFACLSSGEINLWDCDVFGATDGVLLRDTSGTGLAIHHIYGGRYRSTLDAITAGGGTTINVIGARARGDQADIYGDGGKINVNWCDFRDEMAVGNGIQYNTGQCIGSLNLQNGQLTMAALGTPADVGLNRSAASVLKVTDGSTNRGDLEVLDEAYGSSWNGSLEVPTKNAIWDSLSPIGHSHNYVSGIRVTGFGNMTGVINFSGLGTVTVLTGINNSIYFSGSSIGVSSDHGDGINLSGNLQSTGISLKNSINLLSGNVITTGQTLNNKIISLSGFVRNTSISVTGFATAFTGLIGFSGLGNVTVFTGTNNSILFSGNRSDAINLSGHLATTGTTLNNKINSLSGYNDNFFVHRINDESITGIKTFATTIIATDIRASLGGGSLSDNTSKTSLSFQNRQTTDSVETISLDWENRVMYDNDELIVISLDWQNRILSGNWKTNNLNVIGNLTVSGQSITGGNFYTNNNPSGFITSGEYYKPTQTYNLLLDWRSGNVFQHTFTGNVSFRFTGERDGQTIVVSTRNTGILWHSGIWPTNVRWANDITPQQTSGNKTDIQTFIRVGTGIFGSSVQNFTNY